MPEQESAPAHAPQSGRAWQAVLEHVESQLIAGELLPGDRLPGERQLSTDLAVGRSSVREALRVLEALGLVRTATGSGPSAGAVIVATPDGAMASLMRLQVAARAFPVQDIVDTRLLVEASVVATLASRAGAGIDLAPAIALLDAMDDPTLDPHGFLALDAAFHLSLAEIAGNRVLAATMAGLRAGIEGYVQAGSDGLPDWAGTAGRLRREHRAILAACAGGDPDLARRLVTDHIAGYHAEIAPHRPASIREDARTW